MLSIFVRVGRPSSSDPWSADLLSGSFLNFFLADNIKKQVIVYIMSLKMKRVPKFKAKSCAEGLYHRVFNNV